MGVIDLLRQYADTGGGAAVGYRRPRSRQPEVIDQIQRLRDWKKENEAANAQHLQDLSTSGMALARGGDQSPEQQAALARATEHIASGMNIGGMAGRVQNLATMPLKDIPEQAAAHTPLEQVLPYVGKTKSGDPLSYVYRRDKWDSRDIDAFVGDKQVGGVGYFDRNPTGEQTAPSVFVEPEFRRQGVATSVYDTAKRMGGDLQVPTSAQSHEGAAFRQAYDQHNPAPYEIQLLIDALRNRQ